MNVLERWVEEELTRVPPGPSADELRRRARARRARRAGSVATVAIVFAVARNRGDAAITDEPSRPGDRTGSDRIDDDAHDRDPRTRRLPLATTAEFPPLAKMIRTVTGVVQSNADPKAVVANPASAEIVATTDTKAFAIWGGTHDDKPIYVVQVVGKFVCDSCSGPVASKAPRGDALQVLFDASGNGTGFGFSPQPRDIAQLGKVYRLSLPG